MHPYDPTYVWTRHTTTSPYLSGSYRTPGHGTLPKVRIDPSHIVRLYVASINKYVSVRLISFAWTRHRTSPHRPGTSHIRTRHLSRKSASVRIISYAWKNHASEITHRSASYGTPEDGTRQKPRIGQVHRTPERCISLKNSTLVRHIVRWDAVYISQAHIGIVHGTPGHDISSASPCGAPCLHPSFKTARIGVPRCHARKRHTTAATHLPSIPRRHVPVERGTRQLQYSRCLPSVATRFLLLTSRCAFLSLRHAALASLYFAASFPIFPSRRSFLSFRRTALASSTVAPIFPLSVGKQIFLTSRPACRAAPIRCDMSVACNVTFPLLADPCALTLRLCR